MNERAAGLLLFVLAVAIFAGSVLRVPLLESTRLDLLPSPDNAWPISLPRANRVDLAPP